MDLQAALTRIDPLVIDGIEILDNPLRGVPGPRRPRVDEVHVRYGTTAFRLAVRVEEAPDSRGLDDRARSLKQRTPKGAIPVLAAPYLGPTLRRRLEQSGLGWLDSLGNIHIQRDRPALLLHIEARGTRASLPRFRGRLFSPAHGRVARALLEAPDEAHRLKELATVAETDVSSVSRAMKVFLEANLVERTSDGWRLPDPASLVDSWLDRTLALPRSVPERWFYGSEDPMQLMSRAAESARREGIKIAFTAVRASALALGKAPGIQTPVEAYVEPFDRAYRLIELLSAPDETQSHANVRLISSPHGGAFVSVDPHATIPVVGRLQLITDLFRAGRDGEAMAQVVRALWGI